MHSSDSCFSQGEDESEKAPQSLSPYPATRETSFCSASSPSCHNAESLAANAKEVNDLQDVAFRDRLAEAASSLTRIALDTLSTQGTSVPNSPRRAKQNGCVAYSANSGSEDNNSFCEETARRKDSVSGYRYDSLAKLDKPFPRPIRRLLEITELPFMIMWVYFVYWIIIVSLCATKVRNTVWLSAAVAGVLVGIGLNANAYRTITRHGTIDYGVIIRFFLIPFGVSSLSGMTNSLREDFLLVFPRDPFELALSLCIPALVIICLTAVRVTLLLQLRVKMTFRVLLLNGSLTDRCRPKKKHGHVSCDNVLPHVSSDAP